MFVAMASSTWILMTSQCRPSFSFLFGLFKAYSLKENSYWSSVIIVHVLWASVYVLFAYTFLL